MKFGPMPLAVVDDRDQIEESYQHCIRALEAERDKLNDTIELLTQRLAELRKGRG